MCGKLECALWAVPLLQHELMFTFVNPALCAHLHAAGVGQESLRRENKVVVTLPEMFLMKTHILDMDLLVETTFTLGPVMRKLFTVL